MTQALLRTLLIVVSLSGCKSVGDVRIHSHQETGLVRQGKSIPHKEAAGEYGCASWDDIRTLIELSQSCEISK